ncbi:MAG: hypothetical protein ACLPSW_33380 [Roseiarcus sp.]
MAKVQVTMKSGTKLTIEGVPEEVAELVARLEGHSDKGARGKKGNTNGVAPRSRSKAGIVALISELIDGGYFKKPRDLSAVKMTLEEQGHLYPVTTLSPILLRLTRKRQLRRIKQKNRWLYTR